MGQVLGITNRGKRDYKSGPRDFKSGQRLQIGAKGISNRGRDYKIGAGITNQCRTSSIARKRKIRFCISIELSFFLVIVQILNIYHCKWFLNKMINLWFFFGTSKLKGKIAKLRHEKWIHSELPLWKHNERTYCG